MGVGTCEREVSKRQDVVQVSLLVVLIIAQCILILLLFRLLTVRIVGDQDSETGGADYEDAVGF